jgi:aryl-alcohol dehydrogenase-like predicted oxidoreductase
MDKDWSVVFEARSELRWCDFHQDGFSIDLHQVHWHVGCFSSYAAQMAAMAELVGQGKTRIVGISNFPAKGMRTCHTALQEHGIALCTNQVRYSLLDRRIEAKGVIAAAKELGVTIIAYSPLAQGLLTGKFHDDPSLVKDRPGPRKWMPSFRKRGMEKSRPVVDELRKIANHQACSPSQVALAWLIQFHGDTVVAIPGATKVEHVRESAGAMAVELTKEELQRLDAVSRPFLN